jgi:hypothetical protein
MGDFDAAERAARAAVALSQSAPTLAVQATAVLARALLGLGRIDEAMRAAAEASSQLAEFGTVEEGESLVRLTYAEALAASGRQAEATAAIASARTALLARAEKLSDPTWRERFLRDVPDNARTLELARAHPDMPGDHQDTSRVPLRGYERSPARAARVLSPARPASGPEGTSRASRDSS